MTMENLSFAAAYARFLRFERAWNRAPENWADDHPQEIKHHSRTMDALYAAMEAKIETGEDALAALRLVAKDSEILGASRILNRLIRFQRQRVAAVASDRASPEASAPHLLMLGGTA
jgi:hypothetical protein